VSIVLQHRAKIRELAEQAVNALKTWKETSTKRQQEMEAQTIQTRERMNSLWVQVNTDIKAKNKELFDERPDDKEWNEELAKGNQMADLYFSDRSNQTPDQRLIFDAHVRNRVAAFPALVSRMRKLESENAQLAKDIAELRGSGPGAPGSQSPNPPAGESEGAMAEFDKKL
jgi:Sec-independent protein translocase protein TatA